MTTKPAQFDIRERLRGHTAKTHRTAAARAVAVDAGAMDMAAVNMATVCATTDGPIAQTPLDRLEALRTIVVLVMAVGYASTMPLGPEARELGTVFGYQPSWLAVQVLFALSGYLCLRSLRRHGSGLRMIASRARRNGPLLVLVTAVVVGLIYPVLAMHAGTKAPMSPGELMHYFALTVSCADPGRALPGAMDELHYACLLQGAIWTFRWGLLAYIGTAVAWHLGLFRRDSWIAAWAGLAAMAYFGVHIVMAKSDMPALAALDTGLRLAFPFMAGLAVYAYRDRVMSARVCIAGMLALIVVAGFNFHLAPWTPLIEMSLVAGFSMGAFGILHSRGRWFAWMENWSPLALPLFLMNWPVAQLWFYFVPSIPPMQLVSVTLATIVTVALALRADVANMTLPAHMPPARA